MEIVRLGLIGAGGMANGVHYPSLAEFPDVKLIAVSYTHLTLPTKRIV